MPSMQASFRTSSVNPGSHAWLGLVVGLILTLPACSGNYPEPVESGPLGPVAPEAESQAPDLQHWLDAAADPEADLNAILVELEDARASFEDDPAYWSAFGGISLSFAQRQAERGQVDALDVMYRDAEYAYGKAVKLSPTNWELHRGLIYSLRMVGDFEEAWLASQPARSQQLVELPAVLDEEIGRTGLALVIESVQAGKGVHAAAEPAELALERAVLAGRPSAAIALSDLLAWQNRGAEAREVLIEALISNPQQGEAVSRLQNLTPGDAQVVAWERIRRAHPDEPLVQWRLGEALWNLAWLHRQNQNWAGAVAALDRAESLFLDAQAGEPSFAQSCADWLHLVRTAVAWVAWHDNRPDDAADLFLAALESDPSRLEAEPTAETLRLGIYSVDQHYFSEGRLDKARTFHSRLFQTYKDNPDWTNNYAFCCREVGTALAAQGEMEQAKEVWRESFRAYTRTVELAPEDVRLVNDRALIAVYHLDAEEILAEAEQELHRATRLGAAQLAELSPDVPERERRDLDEAVGDAWENLAYLDVMRRKRTDRAESFLEQAIQHYPFEQRAGAQAIRQEMERLRQSDLDNKQ